MLYSKITSSATTTVATIENHLQLQQYYRKSDSNLRQSTYSHSESENTSVYCWDKDTKYLMQECCKRGYNTKCNSYKSFIWWGNSSH